MSAEGLLLPSRTEGNTRLYTDEDLERLEFILNLARDLGVNIAGIAIILQMRERMGGDEPADAELCRICAHRNAGRAFSRPRPAPEPIVALGAKAGIVTPRGRKKP